MHNLNRRDFLKSSLIAGAATATLGFKCSQPAPAAPLYRISLAEWSLHKTLFANELDNLDFPKFTKQEFGIDAVEYVNQFFKDKAQDTAYLQELKTRCEGEGVRSVLIMCDGEGQIGHPDAAERAQTVENHKKWVEAAKFLGCHSIRVNAQSAGSYDEQQKLAADGLRQLCEFADGHEINVLVENHGGLSSNGEWLAGVMKLVEHPRVGTLPDFGNFRTSYEPEEWYDRYKGMQELMPFAKSVSAKSHNFDADGNETASDYFKIMRIVLDAGYRSYVGIEYEGSELSEKDGILATKALLERVREELAPDYVS
jgi:sugar phosphate isomerase/epimerase